MQHTATHCNTLLKMASALFTQLDASELPHCNTRTATHCNILQQTATHRNTLQHAATRCNTLQHSATNGECTIPSLRRVRASWYTLQHTDCNTLQHTATHCNTSSNTPSLRRARASWYTLQHTDCNTPQHAATRRNTLQHTATHCNKYQMNHPSLDACELHNIRHWNVCVCVYV